MARPLLSMVRQPLEGLHVMLIIILVILLVLSVGGGSWGRSRYGGWSWSPALLVLVAAVVLLLTGHLRVG